jgi:hypothetical protein
MVQRFYQLLPSPSSIEDWDALQFIDGESSESVVFVFSGNSAGYGHVIPKGLDSEARYTVENLVSGDLQGRTASELLSGGLVVQLQAFGSGLWLITKSESSR